MSDQSYTPGFYSGRTIGEAFSEGAFAEALAEIRRRAEEAERAAPKCFCGDRCDPPFGEDGQCHVCRSRPGGEIYTTVVR